MMRKVFQLILVGMQLLLVGLFFVTSFKDDAKANKYVSTIHNENLNKIVDKAEGKSEKPLIQTLENFVSGLKDNKPNVVPKESGKTTQKATEILKPLNKYLENIKIIMNSIILAIIIYQIYLKINFIHIVIKKKSI